MPRDVVRPERSKIADKSVLCCAICMPASRQQGRFVQAQLSQLQRS